MSCCNKAPNGGGSDPKLLFKMFIVLFVIIFLVAFIFG